MAAGAAALSTNLETFLGAAMGALLLAGFETAGFETDLAEALTSSFCAAFGVTLPATLALIGAGALVFTFVATLVTVLLAVLGVALPADFAGAFAANFAANFAAGVPTAFARGCVADFVTDLVSDLVAGFFDTLLATVLLTLLGAALATDFALPFAEAVFFTTALGDAGFGAATLDAFAGAFVGLADAGFFTAVWTAFLAVDFAAGFFTVGIGKSLNLGSLQGTA